MKNALWILALILVFFVGDRLVGGLMLRQVDQSQFRYSRLYRGEAAAEVLLVGNSRGLTFYQPYIESVSGKSTFNLSYNGMPMDLAKALVQDYLDRYPAPERMVVDITTCDRENDQLLAGFVPYTRFSPRIDSLIGQKMAWVWWSSRLSHLFSVNNEVFQRALYYRNRSDEDWLLDRVINPELAKSHLDKPSTIGTNPYLTQQFKEMVAYAQSKNVKVELVIGPYYPGYNVVNLDKFKSELEQATNMQVRDYRAALSDPNGFGDLSHPNKNGSMTYIDLLRKDAVLP
jgi:hypothetical protein